MPRDEVSSIDMAELARLLATPSNPAPSQVATATTSASTNAPKTTPVTSAPINVPTAKPFTEPMTISGQVTTPAPAKNVNQMTQAEIDAATAKTVASGGKSTDAANRLPGETASQANERITAGYKEMLAKPILPEGAAEAGAKVQFVRIGAGGQGEYTIITPIGYNGPPIVSTEWTAGIIPATGKYTTGTTLGVMSDGKGGYTTISGVKPKVVAGKSTVKPAPKTTSTTSAAGEKIFQTINGILYYDGKPFTGTQGTNRYENGKLVGTITKDENNDTVTDESTGIKPPPGTPPAFVYDDVSQTWVMPSYPKDGVKYTWDDAAGWVDVSVVPGPTGTSTTETRNLASNTFKNTLSLMFGPNEANQPWMDELYKVVSSYYKTGSTVEEAINLSLRDVRNNPNMTKFTDRFKAIFALEDMVRAGRPVYVPSVSEYVKTEEKLGDVLTRAGLQDMATSTELSDILATGKSVTEVTSIIQDAFNAIDTAPEAWKKQLSVTFPTATRTGLAKALLFGEKGSQKLMQEIGTAGVQAAAATQGLTVTGERATDLFAQGYTFQTSMPKFGQVASIMGPASKLSAISGRPADTITQAGVESAVFGQNAAQLKTLEDLAKEEEGRFGGRTGNIGSRAFASRERGMRSF